MFDKIIDLVKDQATSAIANNADVPANKKAAAVEATTSSIVDGLKNQVSLDNVSNIVGMFTGKSGSSDALSGSLQNSVVTALAKKVGLSQGVASGIASTVIPAIMGLISKKNDDPNDSFDIGSILGSLTGGGSGKKGGGLLSMIGGLFGKKK